MRATQAIIHHENFLYNIRQITAKLSGKTQLCIPVKADAYGHGAVSIAKTAVEAGITHLAVATVREGLELRDAGISCHILLFSPPDAGDADIIIKHDLEPFVTGTKLAGRLATAAKNAGKTANVHIKIDTGMGRLGCSPDDAAEVARAVCEGGNLSLAGTATHLAVSDSPDEADRAYTDEQLDRFDDALSRIRELGINPGLVHAANSGGILLHPRAHYDMVRPGILCYGYVPDERLNGILPLKPVMELRTGIIEKHAMKAGETVSYGRAWKADRDTVIAVIPAGYADGLPRKLSPGLTVWINGASYPVVGRICMDLCMVDLGPGTDIPVGTEVSVFGPEPNPVSAGDLAKILETIPYEITCGIGKRVPRVPA